MDSLYTVIGLMVGDGCENEFGPQRFAETYNAPNAAEAEARAKADNATLEVAAVIAGGDVRLEDVVYTDPTWTLDNPPAFAIHTAALARGSDNYGDAIPPLDLFAAIINGADREVNMAEVGLGYMEIGMLAEALREYATNPDAVRAFLNSSGVVE